VPASQAMVRGEKKKKKRRDKKKKKKKKKKRERERDLRSSSLSNFATQADAVGAVFGSTIPTLTTASSTVMVDENRKVLSTWTWLLAFSKKFGYRTFKTSILKART
jgi:hypothetical protein